MEIKFFFKVFAIKFSKFLVPTVEGYEGQKEEDWWIFKEKGWLYYNLKELK